MVTIASSHKPSKEEIVLDYIKSRKMFKAFISNIEDISDEDIPKGLRFQMIFEQPRRKEGKLIKDNLGNWSKEPQISKDNPFRSMPNRSRDYNVERAYSQEVVRGICRR